MIWEQLLLSKHAPVSITNSKTDLRSVTNHEPQEVTICSVSCEPTLVWRGAWLCDNIASVVLRRHICHLTFQHRSLLRIMKGPELVDSRSRFRFTESCVGLMGCLCISYAIWTTRWLDNRGLWFSGNETSSDDSWTTEDIAKVLEAEKVFAIVAFLMSASSGVLCLMFALCWTSQTVRSYSNTRSLLMAGQSLDPTAMLLFTLVPTGFFFFLTWTLFTHHHIGEIRDDVTRLGPSYWLGVVGWALLLAVLPVIFLVEKLTVPDILPDLIKSADMWWRAPEVAYARSLSEGSHRFEHKPHGYKRFMSMP